MLLWQFPSNSSVEAIYDSLLVALCALCVLSSARADMVSCLKSIEDVPDLALLKEKVVLGRGKAGLDILANNNLPTDDEKAAIRVWFDKREQCFNEDEFQRRTSLPPAAQSIVEQGQTAFRMLIVDLYSGRISYSSLPRRARVLDLPWATN